MHYGDSVTLYSDSGSKVVARQDYTSAKSRLADGLITTDGRVIYSKDENDGVYWFRDTQEVLFKAPPSART